MSRDAFKWLKDMSHLSLDCPVVFPFLIVQFNADPHSRGKLCFSLKSYRSLKAFILHNDPGTHPQPLRGTLRHVWEEGGAKAHVSTRGRDQCSREFIWAGLEKIKDKNYATLS